MFSGIPAWGPAIVFSALLLGVYDLSIKQAVRENAVAPVVFLATLCGSTFYLIACLCTGTFLAAAECSFHHWLLILAKAVLVSASWLCGYFAIRELPISIAVPIRATAPLWTFFGSVILYAEIPTPLQSLGMICVFAGYYLYSVLGKMEGIRFWQHKGIRMVIAGMLLGAASGLYDKYLLNVLQIPRNTVQFWFSVLLVVVLGLACLIRSRLAGEKTPFVWRWWIPVTGVLLICTDFLYFYALSVPDARISILSLIRRCGCVVAFAAGVIWFHEKNPIPKALALALSLTGVFLLLLFR